MTTATTPRPPATAANRRASVTLSGIKPTGRLHIGNYAGAIRPLVQLAADPARDVYVFVADLHALNGHPKPAQLRERSRRLAAGLLAAGLDRPNVRLYRQSRVPAITQLATLLSNLTSKGLLNRAHAYKAAVAANRAAGREPDDGVNLGLYAYPVLMAADILALDADEVPVGLDQAQHLEIAVDLAQRFARLYGPGTLREPTPLISSAVATLPGIDGRKMSKSYDNTIELFAPAAHVAQRVRRIVTDATPPEAPKDPDACTLVALLRAFAAPDVVRSVQARYRAGGIGYGEVKAQLTAALETELAPIRARFEALLADPALVEARLIEGEREANRRTAAVLDRAINAVGL